MLINFVDATNDANHYTKPPPRRSLLPVSWSLNRYDLGARCQMSLQDERLTRTKSLMVHDFEERKVCVSEQIHAAILGLFAFTCLRFLSAF